MLLHVAFALHRMVLDVRGGVEEPVCLLVMHSKRATHKEEVMEPLACALFSTVHTISTIPKVRGLAMKGFKDRSPRLCSVVQQLFRPARRSAKALTFETVSRLLHQRCHETTDKYICIPLLEE